MNHKLFLLLGETASGKDSLTQRLCADTGMRQVISYATRPRRDGEGDTHIFINNEQYDELQTNRWIAAHTQIGEFRYCSTIEQLYDNDIYIIDCLGLKTLEALALPDVDLCSIYINVPAEIRAERAMSRGDNPEIFINRVKAETTQFAELRAYGGFDYSISNLNQDKAYAVLKAIVEIETAQN